MNQPEQQAQVQQAQLPVLTVSQLLEQTLSYMIQNHAIKDKVIADLQVEVTRLRQQLQQLSTPAPAPVPGFDINGVA